MVRCVYGVRCAPQQSAARRMMSRADRDRRRSAELASVGSTGLLERSLIFDPSFAPAHAAIAWSQAEDLFFCYAAHDPLALRVPRRRHVCNRLKADMAPLAAPQFDGSLFT